jgi:hypothetical protein
LRRPLCVVLAVGVATCSSMATEPARVGVREGGPRGRPLLLPNVLLVQLVMVRLVLSQWLEPDTLESVLTKVTNQDTEVVPLVLTL